MGNEVENWLHITSSNKKDIKNILKSLHLQTETSPYGYRNIQVKNNTFTARATTKWSPPIDEYKQWKQLYPNIHIHALYKEEFLHFAGRIFGDIQENVDFKSVTSNDVRNAKSGLLYELNEILYLAEHMDDHWRNDN